MLLTIAVALAIVSLLSLICSIATTQLFFAWICVLATLAGIVLLIVDAVQEYRDQHPADQQDAVKNNQLMDSEINTEHAVDSYDQESEDNKVLVVQQPVDGDRVQDYPEEHPVYAQEYMIYEEEQTIYPQVPSGASYSEQPGIPTDYSEQPGKEEYVSGLVEYPFAQQDYLTQIQQHPQSDYPADQLIHDEHGHLDTPEHQHPHEQVYPPGQALRRPYDPYSLS